MTNTTKRFWPTVWGEQRDYVRWFAADASSAMGAALSSVPMSLLAVAVTGDLRLAGLVGSINTLMYMVLTIPAGMIIDRFDKRRLLQFFGVGQLLLWAVFALVIGHLNFELLMVFSAISGVANGIFGGLTNAMLRFVISEELLTAAQAKNQVRDTVIWMAGSPLGGLLYGLGPAIPFVIQAVCGAVTAGAATRIRSDLTGRPSQQTPLADVKYSLTWIWRYPILRQIFLVDILSNVANFYLVAAVNLWLAYIGISGFIIGLVIAAFTVGLFIGGLLTNTLMQKIPGGKIIPVAMAWQLLLYIFLALSGYWWLIPVVACNAYTGAYLMLSAPKDNLLAPGWSWVLHPPPLLRWRVLPWTGWGLTRPWCCASSASSYP